MSENPLQPVFETLEKVARCVQNQLSQFIGQADNPSPTNGQPIFSLSSSFKANPSNSKSNSTIFQPKDSLNEASNLQRRLHLYRQIMRYWERSMGLQMVEGKSASPVTKEELGRATWTFLHTLAAQYPDNPTRQQKKDVKELMAIFSRMYPCKECADHFKEILRANPVQAGSQAEFSHWLCHVHNVVNRSLGKPVFLCERVDARWGKLDCEQRTCDLQGTTTDFGSDMH